MKRILSVLFLSVMLFSIVGCSSPGPEDTVHQYFEAAQNFDIESMISLIALSNAEDIEEIGTLFEDQQNESPEFLMDYLETNAGKITYKIAESTVNGDTAVVTVDCKYVDSGPIFKATVGKLFETLFAQALSGVEMTEEEMDQMLFNVMEEQINTFDETFKEVTLDFNLIKLENVWYFAEISEELLDVMFSGFISAGEEISEEMLSQ